ncbi:uncharacterized protein TRAVEDRAFT_51070 [Trametes versicolor FP-101664 SS1]|uniref:uncharacterized protein n=1 Tax=Trametes versicolor (strain FP-101664) TaxID=717944 RepID=UPI0004623144|nr:uncharacterized protein TRAVEDRAFT_51070 [Trametes versicolor FP-101664 SS1]EIW54935.1 hypothetical protein TRAVEDRAFT_51070 [Trametes versicolor FP-101664 SS1]
MSSGNCVYDKPLRSKDRQRGISEIIVTASGSVNTTVNEPNVFHWQLYLALDEAPDSSAPDTKSVLIDMIPANPPTGTMYLSSLSTRGLDAQPKIELAISTSGTPPPTVQRLVDLFFENGMARYKFDDSGSGCLHWLMTGMQHLEDAGLVEPGASERLRAFHREQVKLHPERHPMPVRQGTFYWYVAFISLMLQGFNDDIVPDAWSSIGIAFANVTVLMWISTHEVLPQSGGTIVSTPNVRLVYKPSVHRASDMVWGRLRHDAICTP